MMIIDERKFNILLDALKYIYGLVPIVIGLDKFFFYIVDWNIYVGPLVNYLPNILALKIIPIVGVVEIIAGIIILSKYTRFGAYLVAAWIGIVIINLLTIGGMYDIALRDVAILVGYAAFGYLVQLKETARQQ
jgi:hypothetical protein